MNLRDKISLTTDKGMDYQSILYMAMGAIVAMDDGGNKDILLGLCLAALSVVAFFTRGSGLSKNDSEELLDTAENIRDVLKRGRDEDQ